MGKRLEDDMVKVRFNLACYVTEEENPFETYKLLEKANGFGAAIPFVMTTMMDSNVSKAIVNPGQVVEMKYSLAKKYINKMHARTIHKFGQIGSYVDDPAWVREIPLAEIVESEVEMGI